MLSVYLTQNEHPLYTREYTPPHTRLLFFPHPLSAYDAAIYTHSRPEPYLSISAISLYISRRSLHRREPIHHHPHPHSQIDILPCPSRPLQRRIEITCRADEGVFYAIAIANTTTIAIDVSIGMWSIRSKHARFIRAVEETQPVAVARRTG